jgi:hypothetical protein
MSVPAATRVPILVTGAPRSGTTWVGRMLCAGRELTYVSEPLNPESGSIPSVRPQRWFQIVSPENDAFFRQGLDAVSRSAPRAHAELAHVRSVGDMARLGRLLSASVAGKAAGRRVLIKDPFAAFSAAWFSRELRCKIVVVVRHPAAVVASIKRLGWAFPLADLVAQPEAIAERAILGRQRIARESGGVAESAALWLVTYESLFRSLVGIEGVRFVRHEDISSDPEREFMALYDALDLEWNQWAVRGVRESSDSRHGASLPRRSPHRTRLDSVGSLGRWRRDLSSNEIAQVSGITRPMADEWYSQDDWTAA